MYGYEVGGQFVGQDIAQAQYWEVQRAIKSEAISLPSSWKLTDREVQSFLAESAECRQRAAALAGEYAAKSGWPHGLTLRQIQVLNFLAAVGLPVKRTHVSTSAGIKPCYAGTLLISLQDLGLVSATGATHSRRFMLSPLALSILESKVTR